MDIKDLDKRQLILLTLLITFVVSIATGIVTVSLMNKMPPKTTQTINNVVQRTIEKVVAPAETETKNDTNKTFSVSEVMVRIYPAPKKSETTNPPQNTTTEPVKSLGQGVIISDNGLIMVDSSILTDATDYVVKLDKEFFSLKIIKKYGNGFTVLGITSKTDALNVADESKSDTTNTEQNNLPASAGEAVSVDKIQQ